MTANPHRESAKIIQFPVRNRPAAGGWGEAPDTAKAAAPRAANVMCGSGWYHEAAIQEADRAFRR